MADPTEHRSVGDEVLDAVNTEMVALHRRYFGREPGTARTQMLDGDMLACVLGDMYTDVEKTLIELQRAPMVQEARSAFQQAMQQRFITVVERHTGRRVATFMSTHHVGPDLEVELFLLEN